MACQLRSRHQDPLQVRTDSEAQLSLQSPHCILLERHVPQWSPVANAVTASRIPDPLFEIRTSLSSWVSTSRTHQVKRIVLVSVPCIPLKSHQHRPVAPTERYANLDLRYLRHVLDPGGYSNHVSIPKCLENKCSTYQRTEFAAYAIPRYRHVWADTKRTSSTSRLVPYTWF